LAVGTGRERTVEKLDIAKDPDIFARNEVDSHSLASKPPRTTDAVDVVLTVAWQIVVND
jgi:hypothetical protein